MSEAPDAANETAAAGDQPHDAKDMMREALERKKNAAHAAADGAAGGSKISGSAHGKAPGKRQFRRKAGS